MDDSVTNRVAGFVCKHVLINHQSSVTSLAVVRVEEGDGKGIYLVNIHCVHTDILFTRYCLVENIPSQYRQELLIKLIISDCYEVR